MNWFTVLWILWLLGFVAIETAALIRKKRDDTLSEPTWDWFCLKGKKAGKSPWCVIRRILFLSFWLWLSLHFLTGGAWL